MIVLWGLFSHVRITIRAMLTLEKNYLKTIFKNASIDKWLAVLRDVSWNSFRAIDAARLVSDWDALAQSSQNRPFCSSLLYRWRMSLTGVKQTKEIIWELRALYIQSIAASRNADIYRAKEKTSWHR